MEEERTEFGLHGLLPPHVEILDEQVIRAYEAFQKKDVGYLLCLASSQAWST
jgi:hypothetical protein